MMRETLRLWNDAVLSYDSGNLAKSLESLELICEPTAKILFNMGCVHLRQGFPDKAMQSFQKTVVKDEHLSVGYFQCGVAAFKLNRISDAIENFQKSYFYMRSCTVIDYRQLGLQYTLFTVELLAKEEDGTCAGQVPLWIIKGKTRDKVLLNLALCLLRKNDTSEALKWLKDATSIRSDSRLQTAVFDAVKCTQSGSEFKLCELPAAVMFRPPKAMVVNMDKRDYLGKAKVVASLNENDTFTGFVGPKKASESHSSEGHSLPSSPESPRKALPIFSNLKKVFSRSTEDLLSDKSPGHKSLLRVSPVKPRPTSSGSNTSQSSCESEETSKRRPPPPTAPPPKLPNREKTPNLNKPARLPPPKSLPDSDNIKPEQKLKPEKRINLGNSDNHIDGFALHIVDNARTLGQPDFIEAPPLPLKKKAPKDWEILDPAITSQRHQKPEKPTRTRFSDVNCPTGVVDDRENWCSGVPTSNDPRVVQHASVTMVAKEEETWDNAGWQPENNPPDSNPTRRNSGGMADKYSERVVRVSGLSDGPPRQVAPSAGKIEINARLDSVLQQGQTAKPSLGGESKAPRFSPGNDKAGKPFRPLSAEENKRENSDVQNVGNHGNRLRIPPPSRPPPSPEDRKESPSKMSPTTKTIVTSSEEERITKMAPGGNQGNSPGSPHSKNVVAVQNLEAASDSDQLSFREGDIISIIDHAESGEYEPGAIEDE